MIFRIELPLPPSLNQNYINVRGRGRVPSAKLKAWKVAAGWELQIAKPPTFAGQFRFTILVPEKMRGDVDNRGKAALDLCVTLGITPDDRHALSTHAERCADIKPERCVVILGVSSVTVLPPAAELKAMKGDFGMIQSKRAFLRGLIAAPAILKLGLWMPVKKINDDALKLLLPSHDYVVGSIITLDGVWGHDGEYLVTAVSQSFIDLRPPFIPASEPFSFVSVVPT